MNLSTVKWAQWDKTQSRDQPLTVSTQNNTANTMFSSVQPTIINLTIHNQLSCCELKRHDFVFPYYNVLEVWRISLQKF